MKTAKGKPAAARARSAASRRVKDRQLVPLDQGPLRRKAVSECGREMARLEKLRSEWKRFEREDKPAFTRWMAATFGAALSELRELESRLREKEALIHEVEEEMFFRRMTSHRSAYAAVMHRRAMPAPDQRSDPGKPPPDERESENPFPEDVPEFEQHFLFEDFLRAVLGINPDRMSEKSYEKMFKDFKAKILGGTGPERPTRERPPEPARPGQARIKEIYRVLVRRLHPDTRAETDTEISALWHEVQEAYGRGDLERLEMLLALTDIRSNTAGEHTSLSQMRAVIRELRKSFQALKRSLGSAKRELAWDFARTRDRSALRIRLQRQFDSDLAAQRARLRDVETLIASWSAPAKTRKQRMTNRQPEFGF